MKVVLFCIALCEAVAAQASHRSTKEPDTLDVDTLALNIYHESKGLRGENNIGWRTIAAVVFNRMEDERFPRTLRGVVYQKNQKGRYEFPWVSDNLSNEPLDRELFRKVREEARQYLVEYHRGIWRDPTNGAHSYHSTNMEPNSYFKRLRLTFVLKEGRQGHMYYDDRKENQRT